MSRSTVATPKSQLWIAKGHGSGPATIVPHSDYRGTYDAGTSTSGSSYQCGVNDPCLYVVWPKQFGSYYAGGDPSRGDWAGSLIRGQQDISGLMYRRNRYYNPESGQFTQSDPIGIAGGLNTYGFANGDPASYRDPYGLCPNRLAAGLGSLQCAIEDYGGAVQAAPAAMGRGLLRVARGLGWIARNTPRVIIGNPVVQEVAGNAVPGLGIAGRIGRRTPESALDDAARAAGEVVEEIVERAAPGADGGISRHVVEKVGGQTNSVTHQVHRNGELIHQHQKHTGRHGQVRQFPDEWVNHPEVNEP